jgi:hypothetical protein
MRVNRLRVPGRRRMIGIVATLGVLASMLTALAPGAGAVLNTCQATNVTQGTATRSNLQLVINKAQPGDKIVIEKVCVGTFTIDKALRLVGAKKARKPVLNADGAGTVLSVTSSAMVRLVNLKITGGNADPGPGGIANEGTLRVLRGVVVRGNAAANGGGVANEGTLTMTGSSSVRLNTAVYGGGIYNTGTLTMKTSSSVRGNTGLSGGGIYNESGGTLTMRGSSSVRGNTAHRGGGITNLGTLTMKAWSSVQGNTATGSGGGGVRNYGTLTMTGSSSVQGNTASDFFGGGGIYNAGTLQACDGTGVDEWIGAISPNDPDDPPAVTWITCT